MPGRVPLNISRYRWPAPDIADVIDIEALARGPVVSLEGGPEDH